jgi:hypothetical protein
LAHCVPTALRLLLLLLLLLLLPEISCASSVITPQIVHCSQELALIY